jgi:hypothetical protein
MKSFVQSIARKRYIVANYPHDIEIFIYII